MLLMASSGGIRFVAAEYVLPKHKPKGSGPVNMLHHLLRCGISFLKPVSGKDLPIEQTL
jgi:hypothetical protein